MKKTITISIPKLAAVIILAVLLLTVTIVLAVSPWTGERNKKVEDWKEHTFSIDLVNVPEGVGLLPGDTQTLSPSIVNNSDTSNIYAFIEVQYNPAAFDIVDVSGAWELVYDSKDGDRVYSYSNGGTMTDVAVKEGETVSSADFNAKMKVIASGSDFQSLDNSAFHYEVIGHGIITDVSRTGYKDAWEDYGLDGNQEMKDSLEGN